MNNYDKPLMNNHNRQFRLICYISFELILSSLILIALYWQAKLWYLIAVIGLGALFTLINLTFLIRSNNTKLCGHFIVLITFLIIAIANYFVRGWGDSYSPWFYVIPILAASLTGWFGLLTYSVVLLSLIITHRLIPLQPFYHFSSTELAIIGWINYVFAYLVIVTTLGNLLREIKRYEAILHKQNVILQSEKDQFQHLAQFDELTKLPNRQYFKQHSQEMLDSLAADYAASIFFIDLDNFKQVNDSYGHAMGDLLLKKTADRLQHCFRRGDFIARLGGDEFTAIILHPKNNNVSREILDKLKYEFSKPFILDKTNYYSFISVGLANYPNDGKSISELMHQADLAMYTAKHEKK